MTESANFTSIPPVDTSIEDSDGFIWTLRLSDRAALKDGEPSGIANVLFLSYWDDVLYAFKGTHWRQYDHAGNKWVPVVAHHDTGLTTAFPGVKNDYFPTMPPAGFSTTPGLTLTTGVKTLASHAGVSLPTGTDPQTIIDANPAGTTYVFATGTHTGRSIVPKTGDRFIGLTGAVMDGNDTVEHAFSGSAAYVVIQNIKFQDYNAPEQHGTIEMTGPFLLVQDCEGVNTLQGHAISALDYCLAVACKFNDNNQQAYSVHGDFHNHRPIPGVCFYSCEMVDNNPTGQQWGGSEQGGGKSLDSRNLSFFFCWIGRNQGSNIWLDYNNQNNLAWACDIGGEYESVDDDTGWNGVEAEISQTTKILYCRFWKIGAGSGGLAGFFSTAAFFIGNSGGTNGGMSEFAHNTVICPQYGRAIAGRIQNRSLQDQYGVAGEPRWIENTAVHNNTINIEAATGVTNGHVGLLADNGSDLPFFAPFPRRIMFDYNTYVAGPNRFPFAWNGTTGYKFSAWRAFGFDAHSTFDADDDPPAAWSTTNKNANAAISGGGLIVTGTGGGGVSYPGRASNETGSIQGGEKIFFKAVMTNIAGSPGLGFCDASKGFSNDSFPGSDFSSVGWYPDGNVMFGNSPIFTGYTYVEGDEIGFAVIGGAATGRWWIYKNGVFLNGDPVTRSGGGVHAWNIAYPCYNVQSGDIITAEFAADDPPSGFTAFPTP